MPTGKEETSSSGTCVSLKFVWCSLCLIYVVFLICPTNMRNGEFAFIKQIKVSARRLKASSAQNHIETKKLSKCTQKNPI